MFKLLAHAGESHAESGTNPLIRILHQPTWLGVVLVLVVLTAAYLLTTYVFKLKLTTKLLTLVALAIGLAVLYMPYNATVTGIVLSAGFVVCFLLSFTLLAKGYK